MTKLRNIKLKHIILGLFLLFCVLSPGKNIAMNSDNEAMNHHDNGAAMNSNNGAVPGSFESYYTEAAYNPNKTSLTETIIINIVGREGYLLGVKGNIIDWIGTSIYNYHTKHNKRKSGLYLNKFLLYGGLKIKITENLYLDVYYSFLKLIPYYIIDVFILNTNSLFLAFVSFLTFSINIRIYKKFYLSISPIHLIIYKILELKAHMFYAGHLS